MIPHITLVGCGNIGRCHLQAVALMQIPVRVSLVDPSPVSLEAAKGILENNPHLDGAYYHSVDDLPNVESDLAILATSSRERFSALSALFRKYPPNAVLLEKVVFTTLQEIDAAENLFEKTAVPAWVNYMRRGTPFYQELTRENSQRIVGKINVSGVNWGLCCNALHFIDLACMLFDDELTSVSTDALDTVPHHAKRESYIELFGTLRCGFARGSTLSLSCDMPPGADCGAPKSYTIDINMDNFSLSINDEEAHIPYISEQWWIYHEILTKKQSVLTSYTTAAEQHRIFIEALRRHLNIKGDEACPIT